MVVLTFSIGPSLCALRSDDVQEIVALPEAIQVPGQPPLLHGFINLRGAVVPVVRTALLFNLPSEPGLHSNVIMIHGRNGSTGLLVDEVRSVVSVTAELRSLPPGFSATEFALGELVEDGERIVLLDCERLLLSEERLRISQLQSELEMRRNAVQAPDR